MLNHRIFSTLAAGFLLLFMASQHSSAQTAYEIDASVIGNPVTKEHLGTNLLAPADIVTGTGTYKPRALAIKSKLIRWPGGGLTETRMKMTAADIENNQWETNLTEFLAFAKSNNLVPTIVLPTKRYKGNLALATTEIGNFVSRVTNNDFGTINVPIWEIGNEFYVIEPTGGTGNPASWGAALTYAEYGQIASHIAGVVRTNAKYPVKIAIQAGQNVAPDIPPSTTLATNINTLKSYFTTTSHDLLILHDYPNNFTKNNNTFMFRNMDNIKTLWGTLAKPYYISEWNVKNCKPPPAGTDCNPDMTIHDFGMAQGTAMLDIFASIIEVGSHAAAGWTVQRDNTTGYFDEEGVGTNTPFIGGTIFSWFTEVIGMNMVKSVHTGTLNPRIQVVAFASASKMIVFVNNGTAGSQDTYLTIKNFNVGTYNARRLYYTSSIDERIVPLETGGGVVETGPNSNIIRVPLAVYGPNEMIKITINP